MIKQVCISDVCLFYEPKPDYRFKDTVASPVEFSKVSILFMTYGLKSWPSKNSDFESYFNYMPTLQSRSNFNDLECLNIMVKDDKTVQVPIIGDLIAKVKVSVNYQSLINKNNQLNVDMAALMAYSFEKTIGLLNPYYSFESSYSFLIGNIFKNYKIDNFFGLKNNNNADDLTHINIRGENIYLSNSILRSYNTKESAEQSLKLDILTDLEKVSPVLVLDNQDGIPSGNDVFSNTKRLINSKYSSRENKDNAMFSVRLYVNNNDDKSNICIKSIH